MNMAKLYGGLQRTLAERGSVQTPAEIHGTLAGMLCVRENADPVEALDNGPELAMEEAMAALREMTLEGLFDAQSGFVLLLPDDEQAALEQRVQALAQWCAGFVYGLASDEEFELPSLSGEVQEVVRDLTELSKAALTEQDANNDQAEGDYAELVEYVRVGVQLIFLELRPQGGENNKRERLH